MRLYRLGLAIAASVSVVGAASATCLPEGPTTRTFTLAEASDRSATLLILSGTLIQMDPYAPKNLLRIKPSCEVAALQNGRRALIVSGTSDAALPRIVTSGKKAPPLFILLTVPDVTGLLPKASLPTGPLGYVLASRDEKTAFVFRAYDTVPPDAQLAADVAAALDRRLQPMLRADLATRQVQITTAKDAGSLVERQPPQASEGR